MLWLLVLVTIFTGEESSLTVRRLEEKKLLVDCNIEILDFVFWLIININLYITKLSFFLISIYCKREKLNFDFWVFPLIITKFTWYLL